MNIICISGKARHGKDTAAQIIKNYLDGSDKSSIILHYADLLKFMCKQLFKWDGNKDEKGRQLLQYVGTDVIRAKDPDFWVSYLVSIAQLFEDNWEYMIIPDCRFPNEIEEFKEWAFPVTHIKVVRDGFESNLTEEQKKHPSETALDNVEPDFTIHNNADLKELVKNVCMIMDDVVRTMEYES